MSPTYAIGIDLGTTNSVVAYAPLGDERASIELLPIPQLVAPSTIEERFLLPSFCYLATEAEAKAGVFDVPWRKKQRSAVGECARRQSADLPSRTIAAAKSWLAHTRVDRNQPILPWNAPGDVEKISPVEASTRYVAHMAAAWKQRFPDAPLDEQQVVLTVPASFDASARNLTWEAAQAAGLPQSTVLLEEPQAAVYAWLADVGDRWRQDVKVGDVLLVCDIGGGTTDFSLIGVDQEGGELVLRRIAVGNHILVGGDNMDLALAHVAREAFARKGIDLDAWQSVALWHSCRSAKEALLAGDAPQSYPVAILGRGSKLIGKAVKAELSRDEARASLLEGFFPACALDATPQRRPASGFREIGLPFESDTAVTRHLAAFLRAQGETPDSAARPTHVLFNGGVFKSDAFRKRTVDVIRGWFGKTDAVTDLVRSPEFDYAVAKGAAYYASVKTGTGVRIRGGTARSYYVGIESAGPAVPGIPRPLSALCVVPFGMEEGTEVDVPGQEIGLVVGEPAVFRFFSSSVRKNDTAGDVLPSWPADELQETDSLEAHLPAEKRFEEGYVPVKFLSRITELGMFELWCKSTIGPDTWKLEFSVREH